MTKHRVFWTDRDDDRYREVLAHNETEFADALGDIAPVGFACVAWRLATPPALDPGYLRWHRRILTASCHRNEWDGGLTARIELVSPRPAALTASRVWTRDRGWRDWPELFGQYVNPTAQDLSRVPFLRTTMLVEAPVPLDGLPPAPEEPREIGEAAPRAVAVLTRALNDLVTPVLEQLDREQIPG